MKFGDNWGPTCWIFFHCLAERVKEESFKEMIPIIISFIKDICAILPCPDCRLHATHIINNYKFFHLIRKKQFTLTMLNLYVKKKKEIKYVVKYYVI